MLFLNIILLLSWMGAASAHPDVFSPAAAPADTIRAIVGGTLFDVEGQRTVPDAVVLISGERILAAGPRRSVTVPAGADVVDATGKYLIPGLVDAHIHLFQSGGLYTRPDVIDLRRHRPYEEERRWVYEHAGDQLRRYLAGGVTTVIDVGGPMANYALRDSLNRDAATATVYLTGPLVSTYQPEAFRIDDAPIIRVDDEAGARELVRRQAPYRPDFIKIWYIARTPQMAKDNYPLVRATIEEARAYGLRVAVHATQLATARLAVQAGAALLVHSVDDEVVDDDFIRLLREQGTVYCPTLVVSANYGKTFLQTPDLDSVDFARANPFALGSLFDMRHLPEAQARTETMRAAAGQVRARYARQDSVMALNLQRLLAAGIPIATGTDAGNIGTLHASSYYRELAAMQRAGMSPWQLLTASTLNGARAIGREAEFGSLAAGKRADLLVLNRDPLASPDHWRDIDLLVHRGTPIRPDTLLTDDAEALAQRQLNAYNARNLGAFLEPYAEDVAVYDFPDQLQYRGKSTMRDVYGRMFDNLPDLHCHLVNRIVLGNTVIDQERVTIRAGQPPLEALAIYKIRDGRIAEVYFVRKE